MTHINCVCYVIANPTHQAIDMMWLWHKKFIHQILIFSSDCSSNITLVVKEYTNTHGLINIFLFRVTWPVKCKARCYSCKKIGHGWCPLQCLRNMSRLKCKTLVYPLLMRWIFNDFVPRTGNIPWKTFSFNIVMRCCGVSRQVYIQAFSVILNRMI